MPLADVDVVNNALARIGERPLTSLDEETDLAGQVAAIYGDVVDAAFTAYQWKWCRRTELLQPVVRPAAPDPNAPYEGLGPAPGPQSDNGWPFAFAFPADALSQPLGLFLRWPDQPLRDFACEGRNVYTRVGATPLYGTFVRRLGPADWPPTFKLAVTMWLAGEFAIPVAQDKDLAGQLLGAAMGSPSEQGRGGAIGRAIAMDAATGGPPPAFDGDPVTQARYQGPAWDGPWWGC